MLEALYTKKILRTEHKIKIQGKGFHIACFSGEIRIFLYIQTILNEKSILFLNKKSKVGH